MMKIPHDHLNLHGWVTRSRSVGPGERFSIYTQGCSLGCPGCFNPETHPFIPKIIISVEKVLQKVLSEHNIEGITLGGGEPLFQAKSVLTFFQSIRKNSILSIILYSGFTFEEIEKIPLGKDILEQVDVLIDGRYDLTQPLYNELRGSQNQKVHLLTKRYTLDDLKPKANVTVHIHPKEGIMFTGFPEGLFYL